MKKHYLLIVLAALFVSLSAMANPGIKIEQRWDEKSNAWIDTQKAEFTYDKKGNILVEVKYYWESSVSDWRQYEKTEYAYEGKQLRSAVSYNFYGPSSKWVEKEKIEYQKDGATEVAMTYTFNNYANKTEDWKLASKTVTSFSGKAKKSSETYKWDAAKNEYVFTAKATYITDPKTDNVIETESYHVNKAGEWAKDVHVVYDYQRDLVISANTSDHCKESCCNRSSKLRYVYK